MRQQHKQELESLMRRRKQISEQLPQQQQQELERLQCYKNIDESRLLNEQTAILETKDAQAATQVLEDMQINVIESREDVVKISGDAIRDSAEASEGTIRIRVRFDDSIDGSENARLKRTRYQSAEQLHTSAMASATYDPVVNVGCEAFQHSSFNHRDCMFANSERGLRAISAALERGKRDLQDKVKSLECEISWTGGKMLFYNTSHYEWKNQQLTHGLGKSRRTMAKLQYELSVLASSAKIDVAEKIVSLETKLRADTI